MGFLNNLRELKEAATEGFERALSAAEDRTPNLEEYAKREYGEDEIRPRSLTQGDLVIAEHIHSKERVPGTVFSNDRRNELVVLIAENGEQGIVKWADVKFYDANAQTSSSNNSKIRRENMEENTIYDGEIVDD